LTSTRQRGGDIEAAAHAYLGKAGLHGISCNASFRFGELDLVMRDGDSVVFIEVRYRRNAGFGGGAASITASKRRKLVAAAQAFLQAHREFANAPCRFDVVDASGDPDAPTLEWLRDAFRADDV